MFILSNDLHMRIETPATLHMASLNLHMQVWMNTSDKADVLYICLGQASTGNRGTPIAQSVARLPVSRRLATYLCRVGSKPHARMYEWLAVPFGVALVSLTYG